MTELDFTTPEACPYCGRKREEWTENDGDGVNGGGLSYCSQDCLLPSQARR